MFGDGAAGYMQPNAELWKIAVTKLGTCDYSDTSANEDNSFRNHIR